MRAGGRLKNLVRFPFLGDCSIFTKIASDVFLVKMISVTHLYYRQEETHLFSGVRLGLDPFLIPINSFESDN